MSTTGNEFTIKLLEQLIFRVDHQLTSCHQRALDLYPDATYQAIDGLSVELGQLKVTVKLHLQLKKLELGITSNEEQMSYLETRLQELENFYLIANDLDVSSIEKSIMEIKTLLLGIKKENYNLQKQPFQLVVDESTMELIEQFIL